MSSHVVLCCAKTISIILFILPFNCANSSRRLKNGTLIKPNKSRDRSGDLPWNWPDEWKNGTIPFVFNFYTTSVKRLMSLVKKGLSYLEERSCLQFEEKNPIEMSEMDNYSYLFFSYSGVLELCCSEFFSQPFGRRLVLITPMCSLPSEVAHATLHGLGLTHSKGGYIRDRIAPVLFIADCSNVLVKRQLFERAKGVPLKKTHPRMLKSGELIGDDDEYDSSWGF